MAREIPQEQADDQGGAPKWMVTFGDALTLLLTFFVLLLTYSTPDERDLGEMAQGFMGKQGEGGAAKKKPDSAQMIPRPHLQQARPHLGPSQFPPLYRELRRQGRHSGISGLSIFKAPGLAKSVVIRMPLREIIVGRFSLSETGKRLLKEVANIVVALPCVVIVRSRSTGTESGQKELRKNLLISRFLVDRLREAASEGSCEYRISSDIRLAGEELMPGFCEIVILHE
jgi:chemotaxis protein MotB